MKADDGDTNDTKFSFDLLCDDNWTWHKLRHSHKVIFSGKNSRSVLFHPNWSNGTAAAMGTRVLNGGRYYWELLLPKRIFGTSMMFGIGTKKTKLHVDAFVNLLGSNEHSWGLSHKGLIWHGGKYSYYTKTFSENKSTRVGLYFDGLAGTLTYFKDGKCLGVAFSGLNAIKESLYPIVCSTAAMTEMILENTKRDFINLQDRCRLVIVRQLKNKHDLNKLYLPPRIRDYLAEILDDSETKEVVNENIRFLETHFLNSMPYKYQGVVNDLEY
ncbi:SPRY domain-containing SOCS box protein SP555 [Rhynchophorus ferrugineus]|uniref:SPRY domain-containing SOCS box protein 3 n=1 Tax=Rhynchophorus ferrugineus TaxID=354439 RepID=A0A834HUH5_RHYFE|nr:hypothetical protein GWI33_020344 [Rhynchophorus ferrugineus]